MKKINSKNSVKRMKFLPGMRWFCLYSYILLPISTFFGISVFIGGIIEIVNAENITYENLSFVFIFTAFSFIQICLKFYEYYLLNRLRYRGCLLAVFDIVLYAVNYIMTIIFPMIFQEYFYIEEILLPIAVLCVIFAVIILLQYFYFKKRKNYFS